MLGATKAAIIATMAITTSASSSVTPASLLPAADIRRLTGAARLLVRSQGEDVAFAVLARSVILIDLAPRIDERAVLLEVRPVPAIGGRRRADERLQPFLRRRIAAHIEAVEFERGDDVLDLHFRRLRARRSEILDHLRRDDRREQAKDRQNDKQFEKGEAGIAPPAEVQFFKHGHGPNAKSLKPKIADMMEAMTVATTAPISTVIAGVMKEIIRWMAVRTSRSSQSPSRLSIG